jgi:hypothetical protein
VRNLLLPPTEKRQQFELCALGLRDFAGVADDAPLDPFALAQFAKLMVIDFAAIEGLSPETRAHLLGDGVEEWSGGACSRPLPNGWRLVILNPAHGKRRNRATLMEEVAHVFLGHTANRLAVVGNPVVPGDAARTLARDYNHDDEEAAYATGAAALVPYGALQRFVMGGRSADQIARYFRVSRQLVEYRIKVTHLWADYRLIQSRDSVTSTEHV